MWPHGPGPFRSLRGLQVMFNKIFCIGFNKTGTSSLHKLFEELGLKS